MASNKKIVIDLDVAVNSTQVNQLREQLKSIRLDAGFAESAGKASDELKRAAIAADELEDILNKSWNNKLNQLDLSKFKKSMQEANKDLTYFKTSLEQNPNRGAKVFDDFARSILGANGHLKQSNKLLDSMATSMANTVKWGVTSSIFNTITNSIQKAWNYSLKLDQSLNDIRIVTGKSADEMERFARTANQAAKQLGASTKDYTEASLIYYQQGLEEEDVAARTEATIKAANVTGQSGRDVSEQLTAIWNGYKVSAQEAELYIDKVAAVAAATAADLEELSTGMGKVASAANTMGVGVDQMNALLATAVSVTREAPETIGTSFRSIFSRMGQLKADGSDEFGVTLGRVTTQMKAMGIEILDQQGNMRNMGNVITEVGEKWNTWSQAQKVAAAQALAGTQQYSRLMAVFENWDMYEGALSTSQSALGTLNKQQDIFMESTEAHLQKLSTEAERTYDILFDEGMVNGFADALTGALSIFNTFLDSFGNAGNLFVYLGSTISNIFSKQIGGAIAGQLENITKLQDNLQADKLKQSIIDQYTLEGKQVSDQGLEAELSVAQQILGIKEALTEEEYNALTAEQRKIGVLTEQIQSIKSYESYLQKIGFSEDASTEAIEAHIKMKKEEVEAQKKLLRYLELQNVNEKERIKYQEEIDELTTEIWDENSKTVKILERMGGEQKRILDVARAEETEFGDIERILQSQRFLTKDQLMDIEMAIQALKNKQLVEGQTLTALEQEKLKRLENIALTERQKKEQMQIQGAIAGISAGISIISSIKGIVSTASDDNLDGMEKAQRIGENLLMMLPMIINNWSNLKQIGPGLTTIFNKMAAGLGNTATGATTMTGAFKGLMGTQVALFGTTASLVSVLGTLALAIAAVIVVVWAIQKAYNAERDAAAASAEQVKMLTENYQELTKKVEEFKKMISSYEDGVASLKDLTKGTKEYEEALNAANEKARELIELYGLYDKYSIEDGLITFEEGYYDDKGDYHEGTLEAIQSRQEEKQKNAQKNVYSANMVNTVNQLAYQKDQLEKDIFWNDGYVLNEGHIDSILKALLQVKSQGEQGKLQYEKAVSSDQAMTDFIAGNTQFTQLASMFAKYRVELEELVEATEKAREANEYYAEQSNLLDIKSKYGSKIDKMAMAYDKDGNAYVDQNKAEQIANVINQTDAQQYAQRYKRSEKEIALTDATDWDDEFLRNRNKQMNNLLKDYYDIDSEEYFGRPMESDEDFARAYAEHIKGLEDSEINALNFKDGKLQDASGKIVVDFSNAEERAKVRSALYNKAVSEYIDKAFDKAVEEDATEFMTSLDTTLMKAESFGKAFGTDFSGVLLNALSSKDGEIDLSSLYPNLSTSEVETISAMSDEELKNKLLDPGLVESTGEERANQLIASFRASLSKHTVDINRDLKAAFGEMDLNYDELGETEESLVGYAKHLMETSKENEEFSESFEENAEAAALAAKAIVRMNKGVEKLSDGQEDWLDILKKSSKTSKEYYDALEDMQDALGDLLDLNEDAEKYITGDWITKNAKLIKEASEGNADAINKLKLSLSTEMVLQIAVENGLDEATIAQIKTQLNQLNAELPNLDLKVGELDNEALKGSLQEIISSAEMTADQAQAWLSSIGFEPVFEMTTVEKESYKPVTETTTESWEETPEDGVPGHTYTKTRTSSKVVDHTPVMESFLVPKLYEEGENAGKPIIKTITVKPGGMFNNFSKINSGGGTRGKTTGKASKVTKENVKDSVDRYKVVDDQLDLVNNKLEKVKRTSDKLVGADLMKNLTEQYELLGEQIDATNAKIAETNEELSEVEERLQAQGVEINADHIITNYEAIMQAKEDALNAVIDKYKSMGEKEREAFEETMKAEEEKFNKFKADIERQEEISLNIKPELEASIEDAMNEQIEINLQKFNAEIEIRLDLKEAKLDWNEFKREILLGIKEDDIIGNLQQDIETSKIYFDVAGTGIIQAQTQHLADTLFELRQMDEGLGSNFFEDDRNKALTELRENLTDLMDTVKEFYEWQEKVKEAYSELLDQADEAFSDQGAIYDQISDLLSYNKEIVELLEGEDSFEKFGEYYSQKHENNLGQLDLLRREVAFWEKEMKSLDPESEEFKIAEEKWRESIIDLKELTIESIQDAQDMLMNQIDLIFKELNDKVTDGLGLDYINQEWELINKKSGKYLDTINTLHSIQDLERKFLAEIDATDNLQVQQKLRDVMESEIAALEAKDKLTQYDVDRAEKRYQIALKQIALEEAQQNKTTMRLRRDAQGNYSYHFAADDEEVQNAEDELGALQNDLYNMDLEAYRDNLDQIYAAWEEYQEKMAEAALINDPEERKKQELLLNEHYGELINGLVEENERIRLNLSESAFEELARLKDEDVEAYRQMAQAEKDILLQQMIPEWNSGVQKMADKFKDGLGTVCKDALEKIDKATTEFGENISDISDKAGESFEDLFTHEDAVLQKTKDLITAAGEFNTLEEKMIASNKALVKGYQERTKEARKLLGVLEDLSKYYESEMGYTGNVLEQGNKYLGTQDEKRANDSAYDKDYSLTLTKIVVSGYDDGTEGAYYSSVAKQRENKRKDTGDTNSVPTWRLTRLFEAYEEGDPDARFIVESVYQGKANYTDDFLRQYGFRTGGYTGDWNGEGRLALLHQKELVLNQQDTQNMLGAIELLRSIVDTVEYNVLKQASENSSNLGILKDMVNKGETFEQNVHIDAQFPNVTRSHEIEDALNNLMNTASQRVLRRK